MALLKRYGNTSQKKVKEIRVLFVADNMNGSERLALKPVFHFLVSKKVSLILTKHELPP